LYLGAALACPVGILRHPVISVIGKGPANWTEAVRAIRWQRVMPPAGAGALPTLADTTMLEDAYAFKPGETWAKWVIGTTVTQSAPARISRGLPLPEVVPDGPLVPFVVCARHPAGPAAVSALSRRLPDGEICPLARVTIDLPDFDSPVAAFGHFSGLVLRSPHQPSGQLWLQDPAHDEAVAAGPEIVPRQTADGRWAVEIPGALIDRLGTAANPAGDVSAPALVFAFHRVRGE
jgi:hypothetical protein